MAPKRKAANRKAPAPKKRTAATVDVMEADAAPPTAAEIKKMTVPKLKAALAARGLETTGLKAVLAARLSEASGPEAESSDAAEERLSEANLAARRAGGGAAPRQKLGGAAAPTTAPPAPLDATLQALLDAAAAAGDASAKEEAAVAAQLAKTEVREAVSSHLGSDVKLIKNPFDVLKPGIRVYEPWKQSAATRHEMAMGRFQGNVREEPNWWTKLNDAAALGRWRAAPPQSGQFGDRPPWSIPIGQAEYRARVDVSISATRSPFGLILAALDCGRRLRSYAAAASPNARHLAGTTFVSSSSRGRPSAGRGRRGPRGARAENQPSSDFLRRVAATPRP